MRSALADIICDVVIGKHSRGAEDSTSDVSCLCANLMVSELLPPLMSVDEHPRGFEQETI